MGTKRNTIIAGIAGGALLLGMGAVVGYAVGSEDVIVACADKKNGALRIIEQGTDCKNSEEPVVWNVQGPQGPAGLDGLDGVDGAQGPQGPQGPQGEPGYFTEAHEMYVAGGQDHEVISGEEVMIPAMLPNSNNYLITAYASLVVEVDESPSLFRMDCGLFAGEDWLTRWSTDVSVPAIAGTRVPFSLSAVLDGSADPVDEVYLRCSHYSGAPTSPGSVVASLSGVSFTGVEVGSVTDSTNW